MARGGTWGSAVASWGVLLEAADQIANRWTKEPVELDRTVPGSVVVATADVSGTTVTYVSIYGAFEHGYSVTTVHRQLSDLVPLFDSQLGRNLIIGGDLNCSTQVEPPHRAWHRNLFERFASFGLVNLLEVTADRRAPLEGCWCEDDPCPHVQTHRHLGQEGSRPWHDDYLFATKPIAERLVDCQVVTEPDPWGLSDHAPVVATFEI